MAARDNPFYIEPVNAMQALMSGYQGYDRSQAAAKQAELEDEFRGVGQQVARGGLDNSALGQLFGLGVPAAPMLAAAAQLKKAQAEEGHVFGTPIYTEDAQGKPGIGTFDQHGQWKTVNTPEGTTVTPGIKTIDTGTGTQVIGARSGTPIRGGAPAPAGAPVLPSQNAVPPGMAPAPGGQGGYYPKDVEGEARSKEKGKLEGEKVAEYNTAQERVNGLISNFDRLAAKATELVKHKGLPGITGFQGYFPSIRGSDASNAEALLSSLKAQVGFDALQTMREMSKTGGALGSVSDAEGKRLESAIVALDTIQDPVQFKIQLGRIIQYTNEAKDRIKGAFKDYQRLQSGPQAPAPVSAPPVAPPPSAPAQPRLRFNPATGDFE